MSFEIQEIVTCAGLASVRGQYFFSFSVFLLDTSREGRMRIEAMGKEREKKTKFDAFRNSGNRLLRRTTERSRTVYFFSFFLFTRKLLQA